MSSLVWDLVLFDFLIAVSDYIEKELRLNFQATLHSKM